MNLIQNSEWAEEAIDSGESEVLFSQEDGSVPYRWIKYCTCDSQSIQSSDLFITHLLNDFYDGKILDYVYEVHY